MDQYPHPLGIGLIPREDQIQVIYELTDQLARNADLTFYTQPGVSIPHLTLFQGKFSDEASVIKALEYIDLGELKTPQALQGLSLWAEKILFLDCIKTPALTKAHNQIFEALFPLCEGQSADPQNFQGITEGQRKAFLETGYPFSQSEYLPHFTLAHLQNPKTPLPLQDIKPPFERMIFEKLVVYQVGDLGACLDFVYEQSII